MSGKINITVDNVPTNQLGILALAAFSGLRFTIETTFGIVNVTADQIQFHLQEYLYLLVVMCKTRLKCVTVL